MSAESHDSNIMDTLKWVVVAALVVVIAYGNSLYSEESLFYRVAGGLLIAAVAALIAFQTEKGRKVWTIMVGARLEISRIVWPTKQERNQTTLIVIIVVFVVALILWGLDSLFGLLASLLLG